MTTMTVSEARSALPQLLDRVEAGEEITITRHGHAVATVVRPDALVSRRADRAYAAADRIRQLLAKGRATDLAEAPGLTAERAEELVAEMRASREAR
jgi:antitoxin (DNA-binding transcriptional repressor) of toxin-antitoxin stability system